MIFDQDFCIHILEGFFVNLTGFDVDGGAVYCSAQPIGSVIVQDSTFLMCSVNGSTWWGGACHFRCPSVVMFRCCGNTCDADAGKFCYFRGSLADSGYRAALSQVTQVLCGSSGRVSGGFIDGGLYLNGRIDATLNHCNFSHNMCTRGCALFFAGTAGSFNASWITVYNNTGNTGLEALCDSVPRVSYANFIKNPVTAGYGLVFLM
jgi:hypothetical protein